MGKLFSAIVCATFATSVLAITAAPSVPAGNTPVVTVAKVQQATPVQTSTTTTKNDERKNDRK